MPVIVAVLLNVAVVAVVDNLLLWFVNEVSLLRAEGFLIDIISSR